MNPNTILILKWILNICEISAAIVALFNYNKFAPNKGPKYFAFYLVIIAITELIGKFFAWQLMPKYNHAIYEWFGIPIQFICFCLLPAFFSGIKMVTKSSIICCLTYLICNYTISIFAISNITVINNLSYSLGISLFIINTMVFFYHFNKTNAFLNFKKQFIFWVLLGAIIFYILTYPFITFRNSIYNFDATLFTSLYYFNLICGYIMYILFIIAYLWCQPSLKRF